jgi:hypothetical protein
MYHLRPARKVRAYRPRLEVLESRNLLSTYLVDHLADDGVGTGLNGSLRYAITHAVDGDAINFGVTGTINLTGALPNLTHNISINGPGANLLTVRRDTGGDYRIFVVTVGATVAISGLTIANGNGGYSDVGGGGILNLGSLTLSNCTVTQNQGNGGGGIYNRGSLTLSSSTVTQNQSIADDGGFIADGGGILNRWHGTVTVSNSTITNNTGAWGGGIANEDGAPIDGATMTIANSTISGNVAGGYGCDFGCPPVFFNGGGVYNGYRSTLNVLNSVVAGNAQEPFEPADDDPDDLSGTLTSSGYNLIGNTQGGSGFVATDLLNVDAHLGPLQDNGGPTQTMALLAGSPALNAGDPAQLGVADQRGVVRRGGVNIGAYQASASAFVLTAPDTIMAGVPFDVTVTAVDPFSQVSLGYTGTATFTTSDPDPGVMLPAAYPFTAADRGTHTFSGEFTLMTPGDQTLTADDAAGGFCASAVVTVQSVGPTPGRHRGLDSVDALFAVLSAEWSRRGHQRGARAIYGDWTTAS